MWALIGSEEQHKGLENSLLNVPTIWCCPQIKSLSTPTFGCIRLWCVLPKLSTFQLIARVRRPHNIKFTFVHIEKFNLTFAQALIGTQFSVGWWRYIRLNWLHLCNISPNFRWKFNRAEYIWEMIIPATLDAHCRGLPALIALWNSRKQNFLMFNSKTWITVVFRSMF